MKDRIYLNEDWFFSEKYEEAMQGADYGCDGMQPVRLPHTCKETPFHYFDESIYQMVCGYRRILFVPEEWRGKELLLTFEGAAHIADIYVNGTHQLTHSCGYTAFTVRLTEAVEYGADNVILVRLDTRETSNIPPFGYVVDYMTYGGIYRDVYLDVKEPIYIEDVFHRTVGEELKTRVTVHGSGENLTVQQYMENELLGRQPVVADQTELSFRCDGVERWEPEHPARYLVRTELYQGDELLDVQEVRIGFRDIAFRADGFYLNGKKYKLRGLNRHQSYPYVGYAMPASMQRMDADILKHELGVNAVRTSHYPQSHDFVDRCDEIGLLVFTEMPGWQHIGDGDWKKQAVENTREMVLQYRNHPSIILWGVRINESQDDEEFYRETNRVARELDESRPTGGVRAHKKSQMFEDVYTYNDFSHDGTTAGCETKKAVTSDETKAYLISEYNGHMYPTKPYDCEEHRLEHAIRHANVLDAVAGNDDIAGSFGWCMFDYNTHKDFGSGDRICYHGVMDMFRNPKPAAAVYASQGEEHPVMELSSSMDIGEHPGCNRGDTYVFTNADSVRMYKNDRFIREFYRKDSPYTHLSHGPIRIDDFIGSQLMEEEHLSPKVAQQICYALNVSARQGLSHLPLKVKWIAVKMMLIHHMKPQDAVRLYNRYIGDWGGKVTAYRFEGIRDGQVVATLVKEPVMCRRLQVETSHRALKEIHSYDVAAVRVRLTDQNGNLLHYAMEPVSYRTEGAVELIGPEVVSAMGGMTGTYVRTTGQAGSGSLYIRCEGAEEVRVDFTVEAPGQGGKA